MQAYRRRLTSDDMAVREEAAAVSTLSLFICIPTPQLLICLFHDDRNGQPGKCPPADCCWTNRLWLEPTTANLLWNLHVLRIISKFYIS
jgi:hypothetical protein